MKLKSINVEAVPVPIIRGLEHIVEIIVRPLPLYNRKERKKRVETLVDLRRIIRKLHRSDT